MIKYLKSHYVAAIAAFLGAFLVGNVAFAGTGAAEDSSLLSYLTPVLDAFRGHDYSYAGALALVALTAILGKFGQKIPGRVGAGLAGEWGKLGLLASMSFFGSLAAQLAGPQGLTLGILETAAKLTFYASGAYGLLKKFAYPLLVKLRPRLPGWAASILDVLVWVLDHGKAAAIAKAEKAGAAAVAASPAKGAAALTGSPREIK